jgi:hypothetical protein
MKTISEMNRAELEIAIIENDVLQLNTAEDMEKISGMTEEALRGVLQNWIAEGSEV